MRKHDTLSLVQAMDSYNNLKCSDVRDRAYGFRELVWDGGILPVDYHKSIIDVSSSMFWPWASWIHSESLDMKVPLDS